MTRRVICGDDVAFVGGWVDAWRASRSCMYLGPGPRATYYLERDAIVDEWTGRGLILRENQRSKAICFVPSLPMTIMREIHCPIAAYS
jgi:hypothetical protein